MPEIVITVTADRHRDTNVTIVTREPGRILKRQTFRTARTPLLPLPVPSERDNTPHQAISPGYRLPLLPLLPTAGPKGNKKKPLLPTPKEFPSGSSCWSPNKTQRLQSHIAPPNIRTPHTWTERPQSKPGTTKPLQASTAVNTEKQDADDVHPDTVWLSHSPLPPEWGN